MLKGKAEWKVREQAESHIVEALADELQVDQIVAQLLINRGLFDRQRISRFMNADIDDCHDPFLLKGMEGAVKRIQRAIRSGEHIWIYGDYDADGVTATSLMMQALCELGGHVDYYIPHRLQEGYGLHEHAIDLAVAEQVSLIIMVDNGISACDVVAYANRHHIDIIITDHHEPPSQLPAACAIINPKQNGCDYPFKHLAGVGVAFKLAHALIGHLPMSLMAYVAIGTIADIVALTGENRLFVQLGLERLRREPLVGIHALALEAGIEPNTLNEGHIAFQLAPRINAAGRLDEADAGVQLLTTTDSIEAEQLAERLEMLNKERQQTVHNITNEALIILREEEMDANIVLILAHEHWHVGVIGIVASKLVEQYHRPTIVMNIDPHSGVAKGSARSIPGFDIFQALSQCGDLLTHYGGHQMAAGMTLPAENISELRDRLSKLAHAWLREEDLAPVIEAEMACTIQQLSIPCIEAIEKLAPFGENNPSPYFVLNNLRLHDIRTIGKENQHLKLLVSQETGDIQHTLDAIGFGIGDKATYISPYARIDLLGEITINEWNGLRKPQLLIQDLRINERQVFDWRGVKSEQWFPRLGEQWKPSLLLASRNQMTSLTDEQIRTFCPLWLLAEGGDVIPANEVAAHEDFSNINDLIIYGLPEHLGMLSAVLGKAIAVQRLYVAVKGDEQPVGSLPPRESFRKVYAELKHLQRWQENDRLTMQGLQRRTGLSQDMLRFIINVFSELAFIERMGPTYHLAAAPDHRELGTSASYVRRERRTEVQDLLIYSTAQELVAWMLQQLP